MQDEAQENSDLYLSDIARAAGYENGVLRVAETTYKQRYQELQNTMLRFFEEDFPLEEMTPRDVDRWQKHQENRGIAITTANMYKSAARAIFNRLDRKDLAHAIKLKNPGPPKSKAMSDDHFERILRFANLRNAAILLLLKHSGRRRATISRLKVTDTKIWQTEDGQYRLAAKSIEKGDKRVLVFAADRAAMAVHLWMQSRPVPASPYVFTHLQSGEPLKPPAITHIFWELKRAAQIPTHIQISPHALRHKFAQDKLEAYDAKTVSEWMGITVETLLQVYAVRTVDELERLFFEGSESGRQRGGGRHGRW